MICLRASRTRRNLQDNRSKWLYPLRKLLYITQRYATSSFIQSTTLNLFHYIYNREITTPRTNISRVSDLVWKRYAFNQLFIANMGNYVWLIICDLYRWEEVMHNLIYLSESLQRGKRRTGAPFEGIITSSICNWSLFQLRPQLSLKNSVVLLTILSHFPLLPFLQSRPNTPAVLRQLATVGKELNSSHLHDQYSNKAKCVADWYASHPARNELSFSYHVL